MPIRVLSEQLASQIAAGEVVERPFSVVKELLENSLDAGATTIQIEIREAGRKRIQIADNGKGIDAEEMEVAFKRHATSKLQSVEDLNAIATLGFRGEALAAISSVSHTTVVSRAAGAETGIRLEIEGGHVVGRDTVGAPQGTVISVENLFYNVPARLKFLKSNTTEKKLIDELITRYAIAYPSVRFRLAHNGRVTFQTNGNGNVRDVLIAIYGADIARHLVEIEGGEERGEKREERENNQLSTVNSQQSAVNNQQSTVDSSQFTIDNSQFTIISGFIGPPSLHWSNRSHITLFVNGRWIKDHQLTYAVIQAYQNLLPSGRFPLGIIFIELPPQQVDVNVHPTKTEVRFRKGRAPFSAVQRAVRQALLAEAPQGTLSAWRVGSGFEQISPGWEGSLQGHRSGEQSALELAWANEEETAVEGQESLPIEEAGSENQLPIMRVVGQVGAAYIIAEGPDGLFLIDQQAAHERVLYEQLQQQLAEGELERQVLSAGTAVTLIEAHAELVVEKQPLLNSVGFQIEPFGPSTFMIRAVPRLLASQDPAQVVVGLMSSLEIGASPLESEQTLLLKRISQLAAIRSGQTLPPEQLSLLIKKLEKAQNPHTSPDGNPTFIYLSVAQLAQQFGRF